MPIISHRAWWCNHHHGAFTTKFQLCFIFCGPLLYSTTGIAWKRTRWVIFQSATEVVFFVVNCQIIIPHQYIYNAWMACTQPSCVWIPFCGGVCVAFPVLPSESYHFTVVTVAKYSIDTRTGVEHEHGIYKSNHIIESLIIPEDFKTNASIATMLIERFVISCDCNNVEKLTDVIIKFPNRNYNNRYFVSWWCFHKLLRYFVDIHGKFLL